MCSTYHPHRPSHRSSRVQMNVIGNFQIDWGVLKYMFRAASFLDFDVVWPSFPIFHTPVASLARPMRALHTQLEFLAGYYQSWLHRSQLFMGLASRHMRPAHAAHHHYRLLLLAICERICVVEALDDIRRADPRQQHTHDSSGKARQCARLQLIPAEVVDFETHV